MCVLKNITESISSFFNKDDRKRHKVRNLKKEEINTYLKRMAAFLLVLLYYELLLYYQLHGTLNTISVYNILFLVELRYAVLGGNKNSESLQETENVVIVQDLRFSAVGINVRRRGRCDHQLQLVIEGDFEGEHQYHPLV